MTNDKNILIQNIYYMLSYAFQVLKPEDYGKVSAEGFHNIHNLFSAILSHGIARQVKQGLYSTYIPVQSQLYVMHGKLSINDTIRLKMQRKQKLACEFDDFSKNNIYNQILKTTLKSLIRSESVDDVYRKKMCKLIAYFKNVNDIAPEKIIWKQLTYRKNNHNYELLLNLCYLLLHDLLQTTEQGNYRLLAFSDEHMERLFERFILEYYRRHHPELAPVSRQVNWNLTGEQDLQMIRFLPKMKTDIFLQKGDKKLIIDAKYYSNPIIQNYGKEQLRSAHLYQIFAYVKNADTGHTGDVSGLLLYAKADKDISHDFVFNMDGNSIGARTLDLNVPFHKIANQLELVVSDYFA